MNSFPFSLKDGEINGVSYKYYEIPTHTSDGSSTILYRGDTDLYPSYQKPEAPAFFSTEPKFVKHYGLVFRFKPVQPLKLLALDNASNYSEFYDSLKNDKIDGPAIQRILRDNYGYDTGLRFSEYIQDYQLVNYLCKIGMDGYAISRMVIHNRIDAVVDEYEGEEHMENRKFHPEMAICDVNKIEYVNSKQDISAYTEQQIEDAKNKKLLDRQKYEFEENRQNKRKTAKRRSFKGKSLFGDDEEDDEEDDDAEYVNRQNPFKGNLFGDDDDDEDVVDNPENVDNRQNPFKGNLFGDDDDDYNSPPSTPRRGGKTRKIRARIHKRSSTSKARSKSNTKNKKKSASKLQKKHKNKRSTKKVKKIASKKSKGRSYKKKASIM